MKTFRMNNNNNFQFLTLPSLIELIDPIMYEYVDE